MTTHAGSHEVDASGLGVAGGLTGRPLPSFGLYELAAVLAVAF